MLVRAHQGSGEDTISHSRQYRLGKSGELLRVMPGVFVEQGTMLTNVNLMQILSIRQPAAVMNLISALAYHGMITQIPDYISYALPRGKYAPKLAVAPTRVWYVSPAYLCHGITKTKGEYGTFKVTTPERTLVDCFKYRNKLGLDVFTEALFLARHQVNMWCLQELATEQRVLRGILPYLKSSAYEIR